MIGEDTQTYHFLKVGGEVSLREQLVTLLDTFEHDLEEKELCWLQHYHVPVPCPGIELVKDGLTLSCLERRWDPFHPQPLTGLERDIFFGYLFVKNAYDKLKLEFNRSFPSVLGHRLVTPLKRRRVLTSEGSSPTPDWRDWEHLGSQS